MSVSPTSISTLSRRSAWSLLGAVLLVPMLLAGCGDSAFKKQFVSNCERGGAPNSVCECVYDKLMDSYTEEEIKALQQSNREQVTRFFDDMIQATRQCSS